VIDHQAARDRAAESAFPDRRDGHDKRRDKMTSTTLVTVAAPREVVDDGRWRHRAACKGMDPALFYPERGNAVSEPLAVCRRCPVQAPCKAFAIRFREPGVWGGTTGRNRREMRADEIHDIDAEARNPHALFAGLVDLLAAIDAEERGAA
jgi:WhiB family redox-sensing transcriptional regulator